MSWGVPGWVGNHSYFSDDNIDYQIKWLKCLRDEHKVDSNLLGLWNERPQGSVDYVVNLRKALDNNGFKDVGITVEATWQRLIDQVLVNETFNASVVAGTKHYPCNSTVEPALEAHKKVWAGEDTPTGYGNWTGAGCWGRKLNQHWVRMNATSAVSWALLWSLPNSVAGKFDAKGFLNASESWSGHYDLYPVLWVNAHWHQFAQAGWQFLKIGADGGSGLLAGGGSYVTLVPPQGSSLPSNTFTLIIESLQGSCGDNNCNNVVYPNATTQNLSFQLQGPLKTASKVYVWCSNVTHQFLLRSTLDLHGGLVQVALEPDAICTVTTRNTGHKGSHPSPPVSSRFPTTHSDNFEGYAEDILAWGFSDVYGSFAVRNSTLTQTATDVPTGWAPTNFDPLTFIGDEQWTDVAVSAKVFVNHTADDHYVRLCAGCGSKSKRVIQYGCSADCCFNVTWAGDWTVGTQTGHIAGFEDTWHDVTFAVKDSSVSATVDGHSVGTVSTTCSVRGAVALGCGKYHECGFRNFSVTGHLSS